MRPMRRLALSLPTALLLATACGTSAGPAPTEPTAPDAGPAPGTKVQDAPITRGRIGSKSEEADFHVTKGSVSLDGKYEKVLLVLDLESPCFPFDKWKDEPPPAGHNWPASCDAFDRNFETALFDPKEPNAPGLELVRAITPFGGPMHIEEDVTDIWNGLEGPRELRVRISTYSDGAGKVSGSNGSWFVTARIERTYGPAPREVLAVKPLVYESVKASAPSRSIPFEVPEGASETKVLYRVTGHGGQIEQGAECRQPADEFCKREHGIGFDGGPKAKLTPWRNDCRTLCTVKHYKGNGLDLDYCAENPCGAQASVRASRANWCPGSVTPPTEHLLEGSPKGRHTFDFSIAKIAPEGSWSVSATAFSYR